MIVGARGQENGDDTDNVAAGEEAQEAMGLIDMDVQSANDITGHELTKLLSASSLGRAIHSSGPDLARGDGYSAAIAVKSERYDYPRTPVTLCKFLWKRALDYSFYC